MASYRITPATPSKNVSVQDTSNSLGLHDTLSYGPRSLAAEVRSRDAFQHRLDNWEETQDNLKLNLQRELYGLHVPMRIMMERKIVSTNMHLSAMPRSNIHLDILMGRDETLEVDDIFGDAKNESLVDIHAQMEKKLQL